MPAYSFKERFVHFILEGSKPHTIRSRRKYPVKPGDTLYLYSGLRTKFCKKLREEKCTDVRTIIITHQGTVFIHKARLEDRDCELMKSDPARYCVPMFESDWHVLSQEEKNALAWKDGFRPEGSTLDAPGDAFNLKLRFWRQTHDMPFIGDIIHWDPSSVPADGAYCD